MLAAEQSQAVQLEEPVSSLLEQKGRVIWSIPPEASVFEALESMSGKQIGSLLVFSNGQLAGIVTERDYARKVILKGRQSRETRVSEIMSAPVVCVSPAQTIAECMRLMTLRRIRYLPVAEAGRIDGIVSIGDLVNWIIGAQEDTIRHLRNYITGSYPA